jgi:hypothetical protein
VYGGCGLLGMKIEASLATCGVIHHRANECSYSFKVARNNTRAGQCYYYLIQDVILQSEVRDEALLVGGGAVRTRYANSQLPSLPNGNASTS